MPNRDKSPLDDDKKTATLGLWRLSIHSLAEDGGQGAAEGPLELRVSVELDPVNGGMSIQLGAGGRSNTPAEPVYAAPRYGQDNLAFVVKVKVVDLDGPLKREIAPDDSASTTLNWTLKRGEGSSLPVSLRLPEVGGRLRLSARVSMVLQASWKEDEVDLPGTTGPLERLPPVPKL